MQTLDRVRARTAPEINAQIDFVIESRVGEYAQRTYAEIAQRIEALEREWDIERWLETNASALAFSGLVLGLTRHRAWLALPTVVLPFLFLHAVRGWCPPVPLLRRLGVRTRQEIEREKYALKALRGDFAAIRPMSAAEVAVRAARQA